MVSDPDGRVRPTPTTWGEEGIDSGRAGSIARSRALGDARDVAGVIGDAGGPGCPVPIFRRYEETGLAGDGKVSELTVPASHLLFSAATADNRSIGLAAIRDLTNSIASSPAPWRSIVSIGKSPPWQYLDTRSKSTEHSTRDCTSRENKSASIPASLSRNGTSAVKSS